MSVAIQIGDILRETLNITDENIAFERDTALFGGLPEFDSMAVITILSAIEQSFDCVIDDDEVDASIFETVGSLADFVQAKTQV